jgi:hypothetical protein
LRHGDRITIGKSVLRFGSDEEVAARLALLQTAPGTQSNHTSALDSIPATIPAEKLAAEFDHDAEFDLSVDGNVRVDHGTVFVGPRPLPPLPQKLTPAQAASLAELLEFFHRKLSASSENIRATTEDGTVSLGFADWQEIQALQHVLARYIRAMSGGEE